MNIFDIIGSALDLYIEFFWISATLTFYLGLELGRYLEGRPYIFAELYRKFRAWRKKR